MFLQWLVVYTFCICFLSYWTIPQVFSHKRLHKKAALYVTWCCCGAAGSTSTNLQGPQVWVCFIICICMVSYCSVDFPPIFYKHAIRWTGDFGKLPLVVNESMWMCVYIVPYIHLSCQYNHKTLMLMQIRQRRNTTGVEYNVEFFLLMFILRRKISNIYKNTK